VNIKILACQIIGPAAAGSAGPVPTALRETDRQTDKCSDIYMHVILCGLNDKLLR